MISAFPKINPAFLQPIRGRHQHVLSRWREKLLPKRADPTAATTAAAGQAMLSSLVGLLVAWHCWRWLAAVAMACSFPSACSRATSNGLLGAAAALGVAARGDDEVVRDQGQQVSDWHPEAGRVYRELSELASRLKKTGKTRT